MMNAMRRHPGDRSALERQCSAHRQEVFDRLRRAIASMRKQPMVAHADPDAAGHPPEEYRHREVLPAKPKQGYERTTVNSHHEGGHTPVEALRPAVNYTFI